MMELCPGYHLATLLLRRQFAKRISYPEEVKGIGGDRTRLATIVVHIFARVCSANITSLRAACAVVWLTSAVVVYY